MPDSGSCARKRAGDYMHDRGALAIPRPPSRTSEEATQTTTLALAGAKFTHPVACESARQLLGWRQARPSEKEHLARVRSWQTGRHASPLRAPRAGAHPLSKGYMP